jgi:hypothetical protein
MNPLVSLIALFASMKVDIAARFNAALANRPPLEGVEGANVALSVLRELDWAKERVERLGTELNATLSAAATIIPGFEFRQGEAIEAAAARLVEKYGDDLSAKALSAAIAAKSVLPMVDHQTAIDDAVTSAKSEVRNEIETKFNAKLDEIKLIAERRNQLVEKLGVAAAALSDADLLAPDHEARVTQVEARVTQLAAAGITPDAKPLSFVSLIACGMDETGTKEFEARLETLKEHAPVVNLQASGGPKAATPAGTVTSGNAETKRKNVI